MSMMGSPSMNMASPRMASPMMTPFANPTLSPRGHMRSPSLNPQTLRPAASFGDASGHLAVGPPAGYGHARHRSSPNASIVPSYCSISTSFTSTLTSALAQNLRRSRLWSQISRQDSGSLAQFVDIWPASSVALPWTGEPATCCAFG